MYVLEKEKAGPTSDQLNFYEQLFNNFKGYIEVRLIKAGQRVSRQFLTYEELKRAEFPSDKNIYVGMYERRKKGDGTTENCVKTNAIYLDFDKVSLDVIKCRIKSSGLPYPSMVINSGNGYHVYWILDHSIGHELKPILNELSSILKADRAATTIAQILRVPGTFNVKDESNIKQCKLVESANKKYSVNCFKKILNIKKEETGLKSNTNINKEYKEEIVASNQRYIKELKEVKFNGLHTMSFGVKKGERNFCTARIVQTLKRLRYSKQEVTKIVLEWNELNTPVKNIREVKKDIEVFWYSDESERYYRYAGKTFSNERLEELNRKFSDTETLYFKGEQINSIHYDNELLSDDFHKINGLTFAVLGMVIISKETEKGMISKRKLAELSRRHHRDRTLEESLKYLVNKGYIERYHRRGLPVLYKSIERPFAEKRGFTAVPKLLHRLYIENVHRRQMEKIVQTHIRKEHEPYAVLNEMRYKLLILLESYSYDDKRTVFVSDRTLSDKMRVHSKTIKRNLSWLVSEHYIKVFHRKGKRYIKLIYS